MVPLEEKEAHTNRFRSIYCPVTSPIIKLFTTYRGNSTVYNLAILSLSVTLPLVDFMDFTMGDLPPGRGLTMSITRDTTVNLPSIMSLSD